MSDLRQAYTGFKNTESKGIRAGRYNPQTVRVPKIPVHAAREGDDRALCGAAVVEVSERAWPGMGACRECAQKAKQTL